MFSLLSEVSGSTNSWRVLVLDATQSQCLSKTLFSFRLAHVTFGDIQSRCKASSNTSLMGRGSTSKRQFLQGSTKVYKPAECQGLLSTSLYNNNDPVVNLLQQSMTLIVRPNKAYLVKRCFRDFADTASLGKQAVFSWHELVWLADFISSIFFIELLPFQKKKKEKKRNKKEKKMEVRLNNYPLPNGRFFIFQQEAVCTWICSCLGSIQPAFPLSLCFCQSCETLMSEWAHQRWRRTSVAPRDQSFLLPWNFHFLFGLKAPQRHKNATIVFNN